MKMKEENKNKFDPSIVKRDIDTMLWSMRLQYVRRYFHQKFWETETRNAEYAFLPAGLKV